MPDTRMEPDYFNMCGDPDCYCDRARSNATAPRRSYPKTATSPERVPDQPPPSQDNTRPPIADMVKQDVLSEYFGAQGVVSELIEDIEERKQVGIARYGTPLRGFNGRDALVDLYQEILDALNYMRQVIYERSLPADDTDVSDLIKLATNYRSLIGTAAYIRDLMDRSPLT